MDTRAPIPIPPVKAKKKKKKWKQTCRKQTEEHPEKSKRNSNPLGSEHRIESNQNKTTRLSKQTNRRGESKRRPEAGERRRREGDWIGLDLLSFPLSLSIAFLHLLRSWGWGWELVVLFANTAIYINGVYFVGNMFLYRHACTVLHWVGSNARLRAQSRGNYTSTGVVTK